MPLTHLQIADFRNLSSLKLDFIETGFNFIFGQNGSGKTSILEAIYYLGIGRSFRTSTIEKLINHQSEQFILFAHALTAGHQAAVGIERKRNGTTNIKIRGKDTANMAELVHLLPIRLINSSCHSLLEGEPSVRRKFMDWGLFYQSESFLPLWRAFARTMKQRNEALYHKQPRNEIANWTAQLITQTKQIDTLRQRYIADLLPYLEMMLKDLLPISSFNLSYYCGWDNTYDYEEILEKNLAQDLYKGRTLYGPHRADFKLILGGLPAKDILSRGQQKLFVCAMILAQGALLADHMQKLPIYLIDDLPSELDAQSRLKMVSLLTKQNTQIFVTAIEPEQLSHFGIKDENLMKTFHVKHGQVQTRDLTMSGACT